MVLRKDELEAKLEDDLQLVESGVLRDENPLDDSDKFQDLLLACRKGDLKRTQVLISAGVNINGKDNFDYTPLIIVSLSLLPTPTLRAPVTVGGMAAQYLLHARRRTGHGRGGVGPWVVSDHGHDG